MEIIKLTFAVVFFEVLFFSFKRKKCWSMLFTENRKRDPLAFLLTHQVVIFDLDVLRISAGKLIFSKVGRGWRGGRRRFRVKGRTRRVHGCSQYRVWWQSGVVGLMRSLLLDSAKCGGWHRARSLPGGTSGGDHIHPSCWTSKIDLIL